MWTKIDIENNLENKNTNQTKKTLNCFNPSKQKKKQLNVLSSSSSEYLYNLKQTLDDMLLYWFF